MSTTRVSNRRSQADQSSVVDSVRNFDASKYSSQSWGSPLTPLIGLFIFAVLLGFSFFFTLLPMFEDITRTPTDERSPRGLFHSNNLDSFINLGSGFLVTFIAALFIFSAAALCGLSYGEGSKFLMYSVVALLFLGFSYHLCVVAARDVNSTWFMIWSVISVLASVAIGGLGFYRIMQNEKMAKEAEENNGVVGAPKETDALIQDGEKSSETVKDHDDKPTVLSPNDIESIKLRYKLGMVFLVVLVIGLILLVWAHWEMYTVLSEEDEKTRPPVPTVTP